MKILPNLFAIAPVNHQKQKDLLYMLILVSAASD